MNCNQKPDARNGEEWADEKSRTENNMAYAVRGCTQITEQRRDKLITPARKRTE